MQDFRKLRVWRKAVALAINVRKATERFPRSGYSELKAQMVSAAESIVFTLIEGCGAATQKEFARFIDMSIKSTTELEGELDLAYRYAVLSDDMFRSLAPETIDIRRMLLGLRGTVLDTINEAPTERSWSISNATRATQNTERIARSRHTDSPPVADATPTGRGDAKQESRAANADARFIPP